MDQKRRRARPAGPDAELSDAAYRTHDEAIGYLHQVEKMSCEIRKGRMRNVAHSENWEPSVAELVAKGFWEETANGYRVVHHADVIRQSLAAQQKSRETSKKTSARHRANQKRESVDNDISASLTGDVTRHVQRHADRQTDA